MANAGTVSPVSARPFQARPTEPVGGIRDGVPIHPEAEHTTPEEMWEEQVRRRRRDERRRKMPERRPPDPDHQVDEYAR